jgi:hypothetical protein
VHHHAWLSFFNFSTTRPESVSVPFGMNMEILEAQVAEAA